MAILYGTQSNGETLPVEVNEFGQLVAQGIEGPPGPEGPPGVGELPPGAFDGAYLGWENGELVWFGTPIPPVISTRFRPVLYSGNGGTQSIDCGFNPDLVWVKSRNIPSSHNLYDTIRGDNLRLVSNATSAEQNFTFAFKPDGFNPIALNETGTDYVAWCWNAGDTTVTNNEGTIESQVSSNGNFSVVSYFGNNTNNASIGHGLTTAPNLILVKSLNESADWVVYHSRTDFGETLKLNGIDRAENNGFLGSTAPTARTFSIGIGGEINAGSGPYIAYCWAKTTSLSDFGKYTGISSRLSVVTGFRPSFVMIKSTGSGDWYMFDNARGASKALYANESSAEVDTGAVEFFSSGFEISSALPDLNKNGQTYIYAAFANPEDAAFAQRQLRREVRQEERQQNETPLR